MTAGVIGPSSKPPTEAQRRSGVETQIEIEIGFDVGGGDAGLGDNDPPTCMITTLPIRGLSNILLLDERC